MSSKLSIGSGRCPDDFEVSAKPGLDGMPTHPCKSIDQLLAKPENFSWNTLPLIALFGLCDRIELYSFASWCMLNESPVKGAL